MRRFLEPEAWTGQYSTQGNDPAAASYMGPRPADVWPIDFAGVASELSKTGSQIA